MPAVTQPEDRLAKAVIERERSLRSARASWEALWQACQRYVLPKEAGFTEIVTPGHERSRHILDSTAPRALELFASFLHTLMNNPSSQWFKLRVRGVDKPSTAVTRWLEQTEQLMLHAMVKARVYNHLHQCYLALGTYGTAVLYSEMHNGQLRIRSYHLKDCVLDEGEDGEIDALYRQEFLTARQMLQRWRGVDAARLVAEDIEKARTNQEERIRVLHAVFPVDEPGLGELLPADMKRMAETMGSPYASVFVETKRFQTLSVAKYNEFPYAVPRWYKSADEIYGRSPAMSALPDIRMANRLKEVTLRGAEKLVDPPLLLPDGSLISPLRLFPGAISFTDGVVQPQPLLPPGASRIEVGYDLLEKTQLDIEKAFFVPFFVDIDDKVKTATQVLQEADERNRAVSPMLVRTQTELYDRFIPRQFNLLRGTGLLEEAPEELEGELAVEYISPLQASQRQVDALAIMRLFEHGAPWHGIDDGAFDRIDVDKTIETLAAAIGVPAQILRDNRKLKEFRDARMQRQQQAELLQQIQVGAGAAADLMKAGAAAQGM